MYTRQRSSTGAMDTGPPASRLTRPTADAQTTTPKHSQPQSPPDRPSLLRLPSSASSVATSIRSRRVSNPAAARTPTTSATATPATTPSYFSPQQASAGKEVRSPGTGRPPASFSSFGKAYGDTSRGPPISASGTWPKQHTPTRSFSVSADRMAGPSDASSSFDSAARPRMQTRRTGESRYGDNDTSGAEDGEDLFLNIAEDSAKDPTTNAISRSDRVRSRIARSNRQSLPSSIPSSSPAVASSTRPNGARIPTAIDTSAGNQYRRSSLLPSATRSTREVSPLTPSNPVFAPRTRVQELSPGTRRSTTSLAQNQDQESQPHSARADAGSSFSPKEYAPQVDTVKTRQQDSTLSPKDFLAQLESGRRRPSYPDALQTPPNNRNGPFKPSNLHFHSSSRDNATIPHIDTPPEARSRYDGTEVSGSSAAATSMWDELDELKSRMKKLEMGGKMPATSGAAIAQASAERPRTANTAATTVSSSPKQERKPASAESTVPLSTSKKIHPLLHDALAKVKSHAAPAVYRTLEATAQEALALAEMAGSGGPQGTFHSTSSILGGHALPDRQVRRKADHICRNLTELCIELSNSSKPFTFSSPALQRTSTAAVSRRPSLQLNGDSPTIRKSIEPESDVHPRSSPSRAMSRIEARRTSVLGRREASQEPPTPSQSQAPSRLDARLDRTSTSLYRRHERTPGDDDDPTLTLRAPSRAMTDFRETRAAHKSRYSREYTSQEPMPDLQPSPALPTPIPSSRRTTLTGNENNLLYRDRDNTQSALGATRRYGLTSQNFPATEKHPVARTQFASNRNSVGGSFPLGRSASLSRRRVNAD
ncbi:hypothetical protein DPSP01_003328 [Paraphaeosphaeria sporulosa]|uniref:Uncharacterized protein n=1 Tax=Paraphaeosphaeria sporulosa TaxID=1460663 RepID=A0A177CXQ1_9PLEO|nr:uncharacterized protein CC84DRAFT_1170809 [Paraphaeosphaeria sporulosa]OAG11996.1 hypothetical protein CC84DRAFT_1170809 [Paraphaeosphaeria sporulosa]